MSIKYFTGVYKFIFYIFGMLYLDSERRGNMKNVRSISMTQARKDLGKILVRVNYHKKRILLTNHKKRIAIVPIKDLETLEALENAQDIHEAKKALKEIEAKGTISLKEMKKRLG
ncbi:type II toxin-antitoxin system Phd/YefM family antitoxin [Neochlamydia sp. EPS4]|uniref:type II toxin-antitoxin system Phd/YefM family antitoxin n=1 Tax=Neochlamydia sp. EPS4 TaxID=1478175 RepID=UPI0012BAACBB|nr:type II toxin-antitoxin system prevent-host-death family antitoxin [Neochlamydia sp. EPS4]